MLSAPLFDLIEPFKRRPFGTFKLDLDLNSVLQSCLRLLQELAHAVCVITPQSYGVARQAPQLLHRWGADS